MKKITVALCMAASLALYSTASAAFLVEVDTDGLDDGTLTFSPNLSFGGDTTTASQSSAGTAVGLTGGDSIFGGDGSLEPDTYVVTYDPSTEADNLALTLGTNLGEGNFASGLVGGGTGSYVVYATWPFTSNVSGGLTTFNVDTAGDSFTVDINQNDAADLAGAAGRGDVWVNLGEINYTSGDITVTQTSGTNSFVSMRLAGVMFEAIPEPTTGLLVLLGGLNAMVFTRRR